MDEATADIAARLDESIQVKEAIRGDPALLGVIATVADAITDALRKGGKVLFCGNGGSATDAEHLAAELSGRFMMERPPLDAEALHLNPAYLTAVSNDYGYEHVFARLVRAKGKAGDVLVCISTSGNSANVVRALEEAGQRGLVTVGLTGATGGRMSGRTDHLIRVPSSNTARIQEAHITIGHILCGLVEQALFG